MPGLWLDPASEWADHMVSVEPCDKHEISNCALCSGAAEAFDRSLGTSFDEDVLEPGDPLPIILGAVVIRSKFAGTCAGCGRRLHEGTTIFQDRATNDGWKGYACCS